MLFDSAYKTKRLLSDDESSLGPIAFFSVSADSGGVMNGRSSTLVDFVRGGKLLLIKFIDLKSDKGKLDIRFSFFCPAPCSLLPLCASSFMLLIVC